MTRDELDALLDALLSPGEVADCAPNGLQFEGRPEVSRIALGVTASLAFLERAAESGADAAIVHHGLFWGDAAGTRIVRSLRRRIGVLAAANMSLFAYHLPLDRHPTLGNNAQLAERLGACEIEPAFAIGGATIGVRARLPEPVSLDEIVGRIARVTAREPLVVPGGPEAIVTLGIVSGDAPKLVSEAATSGDDLFLTGEAAEPAIHLAREEGIHFVAAGHHATERLGVRALGAHLEREFDLDCRFIEIANPV